MFFQSMWVAYFFYNGGEVEIIGYSKVRTVLVIEKYSKNH